MRSDRRSHWLAIMAVGAAMALASCKSKPKMDYYPYAEGTPAGSIAETSAKSGQGKAPRMGKADIVMFVSYDTTGRPVYCEVRQSSGDFDLDERAIQHVLDTKRFKPGAADTVLVTVKPKALAKPKK